MAQNCLVTKLKGYVDNDDLKKLGCFRIKVSTVETPTRNTNHITLGIPSGTFTVKVISGNIVLSLTPFIDYNNPVGGSTSVTSTSTWQDIFVSNGNGIIEISNKYKINGMHISGAFAFSEFNLDDMGYMPITNFRILTDTLHGDNSVLKTWGPSFTECTIYNQHSWSGNIIESVKDLSFQNLQIVSCDLIGEFDFTKAISCSINILKFVSFRETTVNGSLDYFLLNNQLRFPNLTNIDFRNTPNVEKNESTISRLRELGVTVDV